MKPYDQMTPDELVGEAMRLRTAIADSAGQLQAVYGQLYTRIRRSPADDTTSTYMTVANAGKRFSGMVIQAAKRTDAFDRVLAKAKLDHEESMREKAQKEAQEKRDQAVKEAADRREKEFRERLFGYDPQTTQDDLIELFGDD